MELDRQSIERQDFPQSRKGYDPDEVDAHLSALAAQVEELKDAQAATPPAASSVAGAAARIAATMR